MAQPPYPGYTPPPASRWLDQHIRPALDKEPEKTQKRDWILFGIAVFVFFGGGIVELIIVVAANALELGATTTGTGYSNDATNSQHLTHDAWIAAIGIQFLVWSAVEALATGVGIFSLVRQIGLKGDAFARRWAFVSAGLVLVGTVWFSAIYWFDAILGQW